MSREIDVKALVSHLVRGDGADKCRICMGDTSEGQVYLGDTVMMDGEKPVTLAELLEVITGVEVRIFNYFYSVQNHLSGCLFARNGTASLHSRVEIQNGR